MKKWSCWPPGTIHPGRGVTDLSRSCTTRSHNPVAHAIELSHPTLQRKTAFFADFFDLTASAHRWVRCPFWNHSRGGWFVDYLFCFPGVRETICMVDGWRMHTHPLGSKYNAVHYQLLRINSSTKHTNQHFAFHPNCDYYSGVVVLMLAVAFLPLAVCSDWHVCNKNVWFDFDLMLFVIFYHVQTTTD